jgi:RNA polymerase sigma-70 factor (ECF subfamily)
VRLILHDEADLLQRFRDGEESALETVYRTYVDAVSRAVAGALRRYSGDGREGGWRVVASELPDLVQEVFLRAFEPATRRRFDGVRDYGPYLTQIARNVVVDHLRQKEKQFGPNSMPFDELALELAPSEVSDELADVQTMMAVGAYIAGLPADLRRVHDALYVRCLSQRQAAIALGLGRQVVRTLEARLREGLRRALGDLDRSRGGALAGAPPRQRQGAVRR